MRVVFVDNLLFEDAEGIHRYVLQPHLGLISLISVLEGAGHEALLYDPKVDVSRGLLRLDDQLYQAIADRVLRLRPDAVGLTTLGCNFICTLKTATYLKQREPDLPILLGGPHATVLDRAILQRFEQFDVIVRNEAELKILPLLEALPKRAFLTVPGITFRTAGTVWANAGEPVIQDLDSIPIPAYHRYPVRELGLTSLRVDAGRGCPFQCTFCSTASFFGRKYRLKSAARLVEELDFLHRTYGISDFALTHDLFTVNRHKVREFCEAVESRRYTWKCSARMDCVDEELLERMSAAGCRNIYYGIEAGSARMQAISKKHLDLALFDPILATTQRLGMSATVSFITGYPEEELPDQEATLDLMGSCFHRDSAPLNIQMHLLTPEPGTELLEQYGSRIAYDGHISDFNFPALESDDSAVTESHPQVFINHHYFPGVLPRRRHIFVTTAYQALYTLGYPLLRHLVRAFDGRFSALLNDMDRWAAERGLPAACTQATIDGYFSATFGPRHYLTGVVRYMLHAAELRRRATMEPSLPAPPAGPLYRLTRRAFVLRRLPDCPRILEQLVDPARPALQPALLRKRYDFLLHLPRHETQTVHNYVLTGPSTAVLEYLREPRSLGDFELTFPRETGFPAPPPAFFEDLAEKGVLEKACA